MNLNKAIYIFTKDRPEVLKSALDSTHNLGIRQFIIDDSFLHPNQVYNKELSLQYSNASYYGKCEFDEFILSYNIDIDKNKYFIRQVGNKDWNLGYARNFALLLAKANKIQEVMLVDDDITIPNLDLVTNSFKLLEHYDFVGANVKGMVDDSIIGHISNELGLIDNDERMLSGGFLAFRSSKIRIPFINVYNEDWIWLFLHTDKSKHLQKDGVFQSYISPFIKFQEKIVFQEIGEIIIIGILEQKKLNKSDMLTSVLFWQNILKERIIYLEKLLKMAKAKNNKEFLEMIEWLIENYSEICSLVFTKIFNEFSLNTLLFNELYNSISISKLQLNN